MNEHAISEGLLEDGFQGAIITSVAACASRWLWLRSAPWRACPEWAAPCSLGANGRCQVQGVSASSFSASSMSSINLAYSRPSSSACRMSYCTPGHYPWTLKPSHGLGFLLSRPRDLLGSVGHTANNCDKTWGGPSLMSKGPLCQPDLRFTDGFTVLGKLLCHLYPHVFINDNTCLSGARVMTNKHVKWSHVLHEQPGRLFLFTLPAAGRKP